MKSTFIAVSCFLLLCIFASCAPAERSAGKALDNANQLLKSGQKKMWTDKERSSSDDDDEDAGRYY